MSPRPYVRSVSNTSWWLGHPRYIRYMAREVSCICIGAYSALLVVGLVRLSEGAAVWAAFVASLNTPLSLTLHLIALAFAVYHTTTWFNVTPQAMVVQIGDNVLPGTVIIGAHYAGWAVVSVVLFILAGV